MLEHFDSRSYLRSRRWPATLRTVLGAACLLVLAGCGEPLVPDSPPSRVGSSVAASVASGTPRRGPAADAATLPSVKEVVEGLSKPGCVIHYRTLSDLYDEYRVELEFSGAAREPSGRLSVLLYGLGLTVRRPTADGKIETLPKGMGMRAVCRIPDTTLGASEARAWIEAFLREKGIDVAAAPAEGSAARGPVAEAARLAWSGVREVWRRLAPRPLNAAQSMTITEFDCETWAETGDAGISCTGHSVTVTCPFGFDYELSSGLCVGGTSSSSPISVVVNGPGSSGGGTDPADPGDNDDDDDDDGTCTDDQQAIAREYAADSNFPGDWPCTLFTHPVTTVGGDGTPNTGTHGHTTGYLDDDFLNGSGTVLAAVSGAWVESDWRCPEGNAAVDGTQASAHVLGTAGDFDAPGFNPGDEGRQRRTHAAFETAAIEAGRKWNSGFEDGCSQGYCRKTYIHVNW
jgi:hypothetical protein